MPQLRDTDHPKHPPSKGCINPHEPTTLSTAPTRKNSVLLDLQPLPNWTPRVVWMAMAKAVGKAAKYCLSFTAAGLKPELAAVIARTHGETGNWKQTRALVLERNALQTRGGPKARAMRCGPVANRKRARAVGDAGRVYVQEDRKNIPEEASTGLVGALDSPAECRLCGYSARPAAVVQAHPHWYQL